MSYAAQNIFFAVVIVVAVIYGVVTGKIPWWAPASFLACLVLALGWLAWLMRAR